MIKNKWLLNLISIGLSIYIGIILYQYSDSWQNLFTYSIAFIGFSFVIREAIAIIRDVREELKSYEDEKKEDYLKDIKKSLTPTESLYIDFRKDLPYKTLKGDFERFREKIKHKEKV